MKAASFDPVKMYVTDIKLYCKKLVRQYLCFLRTHFEVCNGWQLTVHLVNVLAK